MHIIVHAGNHARADCPVVVAGTGGEAPAAFAVNGVAVPAQRDGTDLVVLLPALPPQSSVELAPSSDVSPGGVELRDDGTRIDIAVDGQEFTTYTYAGVPARPYFWPVLAPGGTPVTRAWPIRPDVPGETHDHKHHRSMYFAFGEVNGVDNWSEEEGHGATIHRSVDEVVSGPVFGRFRTTSDWVDPSGKRLLTQLATVTVWRPGSCGRMLDVDLRLVATDGPVLFGDTKEGGMLTVRVATPMDVPNGGRIENSYGGIDEPETWGYAAHWCDYSGTVDGRHVGIAVMDHPASFRYPTYWHVRDYGLMGANPFALKEYTRGAKDGSHTLPAGETMRFVYRVLVHTGDASDADVRGRYLDFVSPPKVEVR